jgi:Transglutaminase-like superfamily
MIPLRTLVKLPPCERRLVLRTLPLVAAIRAALWVVPLRRVGRLMRACERLPFSVPVDLPVSRLEWAVLAASRRIPMASCLTQALALQFLLVRSGHASEIHVGVRKDDEAGFQSHAWVECEGRMLLSTPSEITGYSHLLGLGIRPD